MEYHKQFIINNLKIPSELQYVIKSYCFYDKKTYETIKFIKNKINEINFNFKNNTFSRANPINFISVIDSDEDEHWGFCYNITIEPESQFQAINCKHCGNFVMCNKFNLIPNNIKCSCNLNG